MRTLTEQQEGAVERRSEPLLLAAGAGSGKTSVLVERFVRAVCEDGVAPGRIMAITFTDRAAGELRLRVRERLLELGEREAARDTEGAFVSTFHGFCGRLLRGHSLAAGLDPRFAILDDAFSGRLRERGFALALADLLGEGSRQDAVDVLAAYGGDRVRAMILGAYQELRSRGETRPRLPDARARIREGSEALDGRAAEVAGVLGELLEGFGVRYESLKRDRGALDFDDLELRARDLLASRESVRSALSERFELLMVDEFQDTNRRQLEILEQLQRENLFTVGDELQAIYGFRHADVGLFRARREELETRGGSLALTHNFRSREAILDVVNAVFAERFGESHTALVAAREDGEAGDPLVELLLSGTAGWGSDEVVEDGVPEHWRRAEAQALAERIAALVNDGDARAGDVAVLLRSSKDLDIYEEALRRAGLETLATVGAYWERLEVGDLLGYLRALANPEDELALYGALACPLVGVSGDALALLAQSAQADGRGLWATLARAGAGETAEAAHGGGLGAGGEGAAHADPLARMAQGDRLALERFSSWFAAERRMASQRTISGLIERAMDQGGYRERLLALEWGERRLANVHKLIRLARGFEATEGRDLRGFLDHVAFRQGSRSGSEPDAPAAGTPLDAVQLMTIHAAKGLEFPVVCVADLGRSPNLTMPELLLDGDRIGLRLVSLEDPETVSTLDFEELWDERKDADVQEEARIIYVAMTRARERLLLSGAVTFEKWPQGERAAAIAWLGPALSGDMPEIVASAGDGVIDLDVGPGGRATVRLRVNTHEATRARANGAPRSRPPDGPPPGPARDGTAPTARRLSEPAQLQLELGAPAAPARVSGGEPQVGPLSYTALAELERCGYRYYLERVLGLGEERAGARDGPGRAGELLARTRGTLIHRLLEDVDYRSSRTLGPQEIGRIASEMGVPIGPAEREEIAAMLLPVSGGAGEGIEPAVRVAAAPSVHREYPFAFSLGAEEPLLTGVIDLLAREAGGGVLVLDYKSDHVEPGQDLEELAEREYGLQRLLYALAVLREGAPHVDVVHWFLRRPREWVGARHLASELGELEERLKGRIGGALSEPFAVSRTPHRGLCETCPGRRRLCSWTEAETLREPPGP